MEDPILLKNFQIGSASDFVPHFLYLLDDEVQGG